MKEFVRWHQEKFKEWPNYESDHGYFTIVAYKAAVERAAKAAGGKWPSIDQVIQGLEGVEVESLSGLRRYRDDHIMEATFFQGYTTHRNKLRLRHHRPAGGRWAPSRSRSPRASASTTGSTRGRCEARPALIQQSLSIVLGGVFHAAVLFLVAAGLQLVFGVQKIVNLACGSFYALGAYFGVSAVNWALGAGLPAPLFVVVLLAAGLALAAIGPPLERILTHDLRP